MLLLFFSAGLNSQFQSAADLAGSPQGKHLKQYFLFKANLPTSTHIYSDHTNQTHNHITHSYTATQIHKYICTKHQHDVFHLLQLKSLKFKRQSHLRVHTSHRNASPVSPFDEHLLRPLKGACCKEMALFAKCACRCDCHLSCFSQLAGRTAGQPYYVYSRPVTPLTHSHPTLSIYHIYYIKYI